MMVFWRQGYEGCSISELVSATGVQRQSLYLAFGDKRGLFLAALNRYRELAVESLGPLSQPSAGITELEQYMKRVLDMQRAQSCGACFMVKTAFGPDTRDDEIRKVVEETAAAVRSAIASVIKRAVARGELPVGTNPAESAAFLYSVLHGLSALTRTGGSIKHSVAVLTHAFQSLSASAA